MLNTVPVRSNITVKKNTFLLTLEYTPKDPQNTPKAGQFYILKSKNSTQFLGRPISVFAYKTGEISFLIDVRGKSTLELSELKQGDFVHITGALGKSFFDVIQNTPPPPHSEKKIALVSGGSGIAPLNFFANTTTNNFDFYAGFNTPLPESAKSILPKNIIISEGGFITDYFCAKDYSLVLCCGPQALLKKVYAMCTEYNVPCIISLERTFACGVGACMGCTISTKNGNKRVCKDGPVFLASDIFE